MEGLGAASADAVGPAWPAHRVFGLLHQDKPSLIVGAWNKGPHGTTVCVMFSFNIGTRGFIQRPLQSFNQTLASKR